MPAKRRGGKFRRGCTAPSPSLGTVVPALATHLAPEALRLANDEVCYPAVLRERAVERLLHRGLLHLLVEPVQVELRVKENEGLRRECSHARLGAGDARTLQSPGRVCCLH